MLTIYSFATKKHIENIRKEKKLVLSYLWPCFYQHILCDYTHTFGIGEIFYRHFSVHSSLVVESLSEGCRERKMLRKPLYPWLVVIAAGFVAFCGMRNRENIQMCFF
jgi:hypothetical protein